MAFSFALFERLCRVDFEHNSFRPKFYHEFNPITGPYYCALILGDDNKYRLYNTGRRIYVPGEVIGYLDVGDSYILIIEETVDISDSSLVNYSAYHFESRQFIYDLPSEFLNYMIPVNSVVFRELMNSHLFEESHQKYLSKSFYKI